MALQEIFGYSKPQTKEEAFLDYNRDGVFINLIAAEDHLRNVNGPYDSGDLSCVIKHLADAEGHLEEAISHSLIVEGDESSAWHRSLRDQVKRLRKGVQHKVDSNAIMRGVRIVRREFESRNPDFDVSKCKSCGLYTPSNVSFTLNENQKIPSIMDTNVSFSVKENENSLSLDKSYNREILQLTSRGKRMTSSTKEIAAVYGSLWLGKGVSRLATYLDTQYPAAVGGQNPSLVINIVGAVGGVLAGLKLRNPMASQVGLLVGAYLSTGLWDTIETMVTPAPIVSIPRQAIQYAPRVVPQASSVSANGAILMGG